MKSRVMFLLVAALGCPLLFAGMLSAQSAPPNAMVTHPSAFAVSPPLSQISQRALPTVPTVVPLRTRLGKSQKQQRELDYLVRPRAEMRLRFKQEKQSEQEDEETIRQVYHVGYGSEFLGEQEC